MQRVKGVTMSQESIGDYIRAGKPMPNGFTGNWGGNYFHLGRRWYGPTNVMGRKKVLGFKLMFESPEPKFL